MKIVKLHAMSIATISLSLAACHQKTEEASAAGDNAPVATAVPLDATNLADNGATATAMGGQAFANMTAASDAFEIETSKLAAGSAASAPVKKFAAQMIAAHETSTAKLKALTATLSPPLTPDPALNPEQQQQLKELGLENGDAFDRLYATDQQAAHEKTLAGLQSYAATGDVPELKTFAAGLVPTVAAHLNMAKSLKP